MNQVNVCTDWNTGCTLVSGRLNVAKELKQTNQIVSFRRW
jgi:hypothetical protein